MTDIDREIVERLVRMETKLDESLRRQIEDREDHNKDITDVNKDIDETNGRVSKLENWKYAIGASLLLGAGSVATTASAVIPPK